MTSSLFCPNCGRRSEGGLCAQCFLERFDLVKCSSILGAKVCTTCGSFFQNGKWIECDPHGLAISTVRSQLNINPAAEDVHVALVPETLGEIMRVHVHVDAVVKGMAASADVEVDVRIERESCDRCRRIAGGYYEGIVQVRAENRFPTSEERSKCKEIAATVLARVQKSDRMAFILDIRELKEGIDIYVAPIHAGKQISKAITEEFGGKLSEAAKLAGRRELYRVSFAVRLPQFMVGDIISLGDQVIDITGMGKRVVGTNLKMGAQFTSGMDDLGGAELLCHRSDAQTTVLTMVQDYEVQVLDPDSYEPIILPRPAFLKAESGAEISVVKTRKGMFVLPD